MKNLYNLIHSLSQSEKRYIKLRLNSTKSGSDTLNYFEVLGKQSSYDFEALKAMDKKSVTVLRSNLDKLYRSILKQLRLFHAGNTPESKLQGVLLDVNLLKEKGLIVEAKKLNAKLIKQAWADEQFHILKKALSNQWLLFHLSGMLSFEKTTELEEEIERCRLSEREIEDLNVLYRKGVSLYYSYFFKEKRSEYLEGIKAILKEDILHSVSSLRSDSAKMVGFEITSLCHMVLGELERHHNTRREQLELLFNSKVLVDDYINKLLVTSNLFTFLKSERRLEEFSSYLGAYEAYFLPIIKKANDGVLTEKFYDVLFQNSIYKLQFEDDIEEVEKLLNQFKDSVANHQMTNKLLISRTYLSLAECLVSQNQLKKAIPLLIEYQDYDKANKSSRSFIDSELLYLFVFWEREKLDLFENKITSFEKYLKSKEVSLDSDQTKLLQALRSVFYEGKVSKELGEGVRKPIVSLMIKALSQNKKLNDVKAEVFQPSKENYKVSNDQLLKLIKSQIK